MASTTASPLADTPQEQFCVVCGTGSHRTDWINKFKSGNTLYVGCDSHKPAEVQAAIQKVEADKAKAAADAAAAKPAAPANTPATTAPKV